jgi:hypothetical protein
MENVAPQPLSPDEVVTVVESVVEKIQDVAQELQRDPEVAKIVEVVDDVLASGSCSWSLLDWLHSVRRLLHPPAKSAVDSSKESN